MEREKTGDTIQYSRLHANSALIEFAGGVRTSGGIASGGMQATAGSSQAGMAPKQSACIRINKDNLKSKDAALEPRFSFM